MERFGLSAVHIEPIRRIATRVRLSSGAGRYIAIGGSRAVRDQVAAAFAALLGGREHVVEARWSGAPEGPWNQVRAAELLAPAPPPAIVLLEGLGQPANGAWTPFAQLNLARDAWGSTGMHMLLWIDSLADFDRFLREAPDLWSHRDVVAWLLHPDDFALPATFADDLQRESAAAIGRAEREFEAAAKGTEAWFWAGYGLASAHVECNQPIAAATLMTQLWSELPADDLWLRAHAGFWVNGALRALQRAPMVPNAELRGAPELEAEDAAETAECREQITFTRLYAAALARKPDTRSVVTNHVRALVRVGRLRDAAAAGKAGGLDAATITFLTADARGDLGFAMTVRAGLLTRQLSEGAFRLAATGSELLARQLHTLGSSPNDELPLLGDACGTMAPLAGRWWRRWTTGRGPANTELNTRLLELDAAVAGRAVAAQSLLELADALRSHADGWDPELQALEATARVIFDHARSEGDMDAEGRARWALALMAATRGELPGARRLAERHLVAWCRRCKGEITEVRAFCLLADIAPTPRRSLERASTALKLAMTTPSIYAQIDAHEALARAHLRAGSMDAAIAAWEAAIRLARPDGLRVCELTTLHALADSAHPRAPEWAGKALDLASELMRPRDEARALARLAVLEHRGRASELKLDRAWELAEELGPPRLRRRVREARLGLGMAEAG